LKNIQQKTFIIEKNDKIKENSCTNFSISPNALFIGVSRGFIFPVGKFEIPSWVNKITQLGN
jgi:hypothetical protein